MARSKHALKWLAAALGAVAATGCVGQDRVNIWPFWAQAPAHHVYQSDAPSAWVDTEDAQQPLADAEPTGVRKATAEEPLETAPGEATVKRADEVIYSDPLLRPGHLLR